MNAEARERWRIHRQHCEAGNHGAPCWGPDTCRRCIEIGNVPTAPTDGAR